MSVHTTQRHVSLDEGNLLLRSSDVHKPRIGEEQGNTQENA